MCCKSESLVFCTAYRDTKTHVKSHKWVVQISPHYIDRKSLHCDMSSIVQCLFTTQVPKL